jgi:putative thiamine transport system ATP-binding protein
MRLLLSEPKAVLLDEPFANLDAQLKTQTRDLVFDTLMAASIPALLVTHDRQDADAAQGQLFEL